MAKNLRNEMQRLDTLQKEVAALEKQQVTWSPESFKTLRADVIAGRHPSKRPQITDSLVPGLRARFEASGDIGFYVHYSLVSGDKDRFQQLIGYYPEMSIEEARRIANVAKHLADHGINIQDGLLPRLIRELQEYGTTWRPNGWILATKDKR
jgi:hypothetical protein